MTLPCLALIPAGRDLIAAQAWSERRPLDRALRAYFLHSSDARRLARMGLPDRAAISAGRLEAEAAIASTREGPYLAIARAGFAAAEALARPLTREAAEGQPAEGRQGESPPRRSCETGESPPPRKGDLPCALLVARLNRRDAALRDLAAGPRADA